MKRTALLLACVMAVSGSAALRAEDAFSEARAALASLLEENGGIEGESLDQAEAALARASSAQPREGDWQLGLGLVEVERGEWKSAREHFEAAVDLSPMNAQAHHWLGNSLFQTIGEASLLAKGSMASKGRKAYERALELDPSLHDARFALAMFFMEAPGIAGGSRAKAREQAEALLRAEESEYMGHSILTRLCAKDGDWEGFERHFELGYQSAPDDGTRDQALRAAVNALLRDKKSPEEGLAYAMRLIELKGEEDGAANFFVGWAKRECGDLDGAIVHFEKSVGELPDSATPLLWLAQSLEEAGRSGEALARYREYVEKFADREEAKDAKKRVRTLERRVK